MKIAITGHTSGIGKALHNVCSNVTDDFLLLSRATGHNLNTSFDKVKDEIIEYDPDIVFNNAWYPRAQIRLLKELHKAFQNQNKHIVSTGSLTAYMTELFNDKLGYGAEKKELLDYSIQQSFLYPYDNQCRVSNVSVGFTDTKIANNEEELISPEFVAQRMFQVAFSDVPVPETVINNKFFKRSQIIKYFKKSSKNLIQILEQS